MLYSLHLISNQDNPDNPFRDIDQDVIENILDHANYINKGGTEESKDGVSKRRKNPNVKEILLEESQSGKSLVVQESKLCRNFIIFIIIKFIFTILYPFPWYICVCTNCSSFMIYNWFIK